jgi:hypothetical protein
MADYMMDYYSQNPYYRNPIVYVLLEDYLYLYLYIYIYTYLYIYI